MPRSPNPKSKTIRLVLIAKPFQEESIRAFKEIVARNGLIISDILFEKVDSFLKQHNWPPGNSQTILQTFIGKTKKKCYFCEGRFPTLTKVKFISYLIAPVCNECLEKAQHQKQTVKKILGSV